MFTLTYYKEQRDVKVIWTGLLMTHSESLVLHGPTERNQITVGQQYFTCSYGGW